MAPSTSRTRLSQWKKYFEFCSLYDFILISVTECVACLYITHLSEFFTYNSVVNYVSALWALHKILGYSYPDPSGFLISSTLRGAKFELGCATNQAAPMTVNRMRQIFLKLDMSR